MKIAIVAIGRLPRSPETELVKLYVDRATAAGRSLGLGPVEVVEVESRKPGKAAEAEALRSYLVDSHVIACDERGKARASRAFAEEIGILRDRGVRRLVFLIGGADGLDASAGGHVDVRTRGKEDRGPGLDGECDAIRHGDAGRHVVGAGSG